MVLAHRERGHADAYDHDGRRSARAARGLGRPRGDERKGAVREVRPFPRRMKRNRVNLKRKAPPMPPENLDYIHISVGDRSIVIPLTADAGSSPPTVAIEVGQIEANGFADDDAARAFAVFILSAAVNALLPEEMRAKLAQAAARL
jgi:hypothetical protein